MIGRAGCLKSTKQAKPSNVGAEWLLKWLLMIDDEFGVSQQLQADK